MATFLFDQINNGKRHALLLAPEDVTLETMCVQKQPRMDNCELFAPEPWMVYGCKRWECIRDGKDDSKWARNEPVSYDQYIQAYKNILRRNKQEIIKWYTNISKDPNVYVILCCYCKPGYFCHRWCVYQYLLRILSKQYPEFGHTFHLDPTDDELKMIKLENAQQFLKQQEEICPGCEAEGICSKHQEELYDRDVLL